MAVIREFQGKLVKRTLKVEDQIAIQFQGPKGDSGERVLVPFEQYLAERKVIQQVEADLR